MARIPEIERRLLNWARWRAGPRIGSAGYTERVDGEGWDAPTVIPTDSAEAEETEKAVQQLEPTLRKAVIDVYTGSGDIASKARLAGIAVATLHARVERAHKLLQRVFDDARAAAEAQRQRVEALQATARPPSIFASSAAAPAPGAQPAPRSRLAEWLAARRAARGGGFTK